MRAGLAVVQRRTERAVTLRATLRVCRNVLWARSLFFPRLLGVTIIRQCVYQNNLDRISTQIQLGLSSLSLSPFCRGCESHAHKQSAGAEKRKAPHPMNDVQIGLKGDLGSRAIRAHEVLIKKPTLRSESLSLITDDVIYAPIFKAFPNN